jgi:glucose-6-phosphate 1-epimerase
MDQKRSKIQQGLIRFTAETDRVYEDRSACTEIIDEAGGRRIRIEKSGSASTVVWNPWIAKAKAMPDFGDEEWKEMCCVESANAGSARVILLPGNRHETRVRISVA